MALPHDDYEQKLTETATITEDQFHKQVASVDEYHGDTTTLHRTATKYRTELEAEGLDGLLIDDLPARANAFVVASSIADNTIGGTEVAQQFTELKSEAYKYRRKLFNYGKFAFDGHSEQNDALTVITKGTGDLDLAHDFLDIHTLYSMNIEKFTSLKKFSAQWLETGLEYQKRILDLYAKVHQPEAEKEVLIHTERKMFAHMREAVLEIRRWARLTFADQPEILEKFNYDYSRS